MITIIRLEEAIDVINTKKDLGIILVL